MPKKVYVVIAAFREEGSIKGVIKDLQKHGYRNIVVVDDGSPDKTGKKAEKAGATVLRHVINRGQGAALQTGIDFALAGGADVIVTFDADGQHQAKDLNKMIALVESGKYEVVLGSRFLKGSGRIPFGRKILLKGSVVVQLLFYGVRLSDAHNGLRVLSRKAAESIKITSDRMEHSSQIAEEIVRNRLKFKEIPVNIVYSEYSMSKGHGSFLQAFKVLFHFFIRKFLR